MSYKEFLKRNMGNMLLQLKCIKGLGLFTLIAIWFILPIPLWLIYAHEGSWSYNWTISLYQLFAPFLSVMCPLLLSSEFVEGDGRELLYIEKRIKAGTFFAAFILFGAALMPPFAFYTHIYSNMIFEYVRLIGECFFFCGACYLMVYLLRSVSLTLAAILIYTLFATYYGNGSNSFLLYYNTIPATPDLLMKSCLPLTFVGGAFWVTGVFVNADTARLC